MATQIKELTRAYDWLRWSNGKPWRVKQGEDFTCSVHGFRQTLYAHGRKIGKKVESTVPSAGVIEFRFVK